MGKGDKASTSEIASCNYIARSHGVRNGMFLGPARKNCPDLKVIQYEFEKYDDCSKKLYDILLSHCDDLMAVSCDEAYMDVSYKCSNEVNALELAGLIRAEIFAATGCCASVGIANNMLKARVATKLAKPNGVHQFLSENDHIGTFTSLRITGLYSPIFFVLFGFHFNVFRFTWYWPFI
jgi:DNA repair protein REV1